MYVNGGADLPARYANKPHPRAPTKKANAFFVGTPVPSLTGEGDVSIVNTPLNALHKKTPRHAGFSFAEQVWLLTHSPAF